MGYLGSKAASGAWQAILAHAPYHRVFVDAFTGSGVISRLKPPAPWFDLAIDLDFGLLSDLPDHVVPLCGDALQSLASMRLPADSWIYCDPPYLHSTRGQSRYRHELNDDDHVRLIDILRGLDCQVMLSGYPSVLYDDLLSDWVCHRYQVMTRGGPRLECLWMNYPRDHIAVSDYTGLNSLDRQRVKRKAARWSANFAALPADERAYILQSLLLSGSQSEQLSASRHQ